jgi:hypothetical protein
MSRTTWRRLLPVFDDRPAVDRPLPYWGWGMIPDPYGRLFETDDGQAPIPDPPYQAREEQRNGIHR